MPRAIRGIFCRCAMGSFVLSLQVAFLIRRYPMFTPREIDGTLAKPPDAVIRVSTVGGRQIFVLDLQPERLRFDRLILTWFDAPVLKINAHGEIAKVEFYRNDVYRDLASLRKEGEFFGFEGLTTVAPGHVYSLLVPDMFLAGDEFRFHLLATQRNGFDLRIFLREKCFSEWREMTYGLASHEDENPTQARRNLLGIPHRDVPDPVFFDDIADVYQER